MRPKYASEPAPSRPVASSSIQRRGPSDVTASTARAGSQSSRRRATPSVPAMTRANRADAPATNAAVASTVSAAAPRATAWKAANSAKAPSQAPTVAPGSGSPR